MTGYSNLEGIIHHRKGESEEQYSVFLELQNNSEYLAKLSASIHETI